MECNNKHLMTFALDESGNLVSVEDVRNGKNCGCVCPACKEALVARNGGTKRTHHFAHQSGADCAKGYETMLHLLAKQRIRKAFLCSHKFLLKFEYKSYCPNVKECPYVRYEDCCSQEIRQFDLKKYYDSCEQEIAYDDVKRRSDLKIFSSTHPDRPPVYIEFCVTHASDEEKLHSGNKIIEVFLDSEKDIDSIIQNGFIEHAEICGIPIGQYPFCAIYGFKNQDENNHDLNIDIEFSRYILYASGKSQCYQDACGCKELRKSIPYSILEICIHTSVGFGVYDYAKYVGYQKYHIPNCILCKNYGRTYDGMNLCRYRNYLHIAFDQKMDTSRAKSCSKFELNDEDVKSQLESALKDNITLL